MLKVLVDDSDISYEKNNVLRKVFNFFLIPCLNRLPAGFHKQIRHTNKQAGEVAQNKTTHTALEILYSRGRKSNNLGFFKQKPLEKLFHSVWFNTNNSKSVRNRLRLVIHELSKELVRIDKMDKNEIFMLSIASGSARAVAESVNNSKSTKKINSTFLDRSIDALNYSKALISDLGLDKSEIYTFRWVQDTASNFPSHLSSKLDMVEMVGLIDYFNDEKVVTLFRLIYNNLYEGGFFITSNISDNQEKKFVDNAIGWKMIYRSGEDLARLAVRAGFSEHNILVKYEPLKVHAVLIAHK